MAHLRRACSSSPPARARGAAPIDDAKKAFGEGKAAFERGDYEHGAGAYQRANIILPAPNLYYNIGATYERLGRYQEAALAFDKYFELAGAPPATTTATFQDEAARAHRGRSQARRTCRRRAAAPAAAAAAAAAPPQPYSPAAVLPQPVLRAAGRGRTREARLQARRRARRTRAIVLMAIGVPLSVAGIGHRLGVRRSPALDSGRGRLGFVGVTPASSA